MTALTGANDKVCGYTYEDNADPANKVGYASAVCDAVTLDKAADNSTDVFRCIMADGTTQCFPLTAMDSQGALATYTGVAFKGVLATESADVQLVNIETQGFVPRGAGWIYGADQYYWFSQIVYGDGRYMAHPEKVATEGPAWWMSGLMRWVVPLMGQPAPHNIILGQW